MVEQQLEVEQVFEVLLYSQVNLHVNERTQLRSDFDRLLTRLECYQPDLSVKNMRLALAKYFQSYEEDYAERLKQAMKTTLEEGESHIRAIWVYFLLILSGTFIVKPDEDGKVRVLHLFLAV